MDRQLKQRVVGAAVLVVLGVIFIPLFLDNGALDPSVADVADIPPPPEDDFASRVVPLPEATIDELQERTGLQLPPVVEQSPPIEDADQAAETVPSETPAPPPQVPAAPVAPVETAAQPEVPDAAEAPEAREPAPGALPAKAPPTVGDVLAPRDAIDAWTVQLGSFADDGNARRLIEKLRKGGYAAYLERSVEGDKTAFKVRVGPQIARDEAERVRAALHKEFALKGMLVRYR